MPAPYYKYAYYETTFTVEKRVTCIDVVTIYVNGEADTFPPSTSDERPCITKDDSLKYTVYISYDSDSDGECDSALAETSVSGWVKLYKSGTSTEILTASFSGNTDANGYIDTSTVTVPAFETCDIDVKAHYDGDNVYASAEKSYSNSMVYYYPTRFTNVAVSPSTIYVNDTATVSGKLEYLDVPNNAWTGLANQTVTVKWIRPDNTTKETDTPTTDTYGNFSAQCTVDQAGTWTIKILFSGNLPTGAGCPQPPSI